MISALFIPAHIAMATINFKHEIADDFAEFVEYAVKYVPPYF
jgi:hypothetical protein